MVNKKKTAMKLLVIYLVYGAVLLAGLLYHIVPALVEGWSAGSASARRELSHDRTSVDRYADLLSAAKVLPEVRILASRTPLDVRNAAGQSLRIYPVTCDVLAMDPEGSAAPAAQDTAPAAGPNEPMPEGTAPAPEQTAAASQPSMPQPAPSVPGKTSPTVAPNVPAQNPAAAARYNLVGGPAFLAAGLLLLGCYAAILALIFRIIGSLRRSVRDELPLDRRNIRRTRGIGILLIAGECCETLMQWYVNREAAELLTGTGYAVDTSFGLNYWNILMGVLVLFTAEVFAIGTQLSEEQELTI